MAVQRHGSRIEGADDRRLKTLDDVEVENKRVIVRADFNVAVGSDNKVSSAEDYRIATTCPTLRELMEKNAKVILLPRRGREEDGFEGLDLTAVHARLEKLLEMDVPRAEKLTGPAAVEQTSNVAPGGILMLPNVRNDPREAEVSELFAKELSELGDIYVNEAFGEAHRAHTSLTLLARLMPNAAGRQVEKEVNVLHKVSDHPKRPYVAIASGAKIEDKIGMLRRMVQRADFVCLGGIIANVFLAAAGKLPTNLFPADAVAAAKSLLDQAEDKLVLPEDVVTGSEDGKNYVRTISLEDLKDVSKVWDVGEKTVSKFLEVCKKAKTITWNGPIGRYEVKPYDSGTVALGEGLGEITRAFRVIGGGDVVTALAGAKLLDKFDHVSVGGGAMIGFLEGKTMPALEPLYD